MENPNITWSKGFRGGCRTGSPGRTARPSRSRWRLALPSCCLPGQCGPHPPEPVVVCGFLKDCFREAFDGREMEGEDRAEEAYEMIDPNEKDHRSHGVAHRHNEQSTFVARPTAGSSRLGSILPRHRIVSDGSATGLRHPSCHPPVQRGKRFDLLW